MESQKPNTQKNKVKTINIRVLQFKNGVHLLFKIKQKHTD